MTSTGLDERPRWLKLSTLFSQLLNVLIFNGSPDETVSGRAYRVGQVLGDPVWARRAAWINWLFRSDTHCFDSHAQDVKFARAVLRD